MKNLKYKNQEVVNARPRMTKNGRFQEDSFSEDSDMLASFQRDSEKKFGEKTMRNLRRVCHSHLNY